MRVEKFIEEVEALGIKTFAGVPDSALQPLCNYLNGDAHVFKHYVPSNEGAAVGLAIGSYLSTGRPACVYMQNSGIGNAVNPLTSLAHKEVYDIPTLFVIGWRGEPQKKDEPQHRFMGKITREILDVMQVENGVITAETTEEEAHCIFRTAEKALKENRQFAIVVTKEALKTEMKNVYHNMHEMNREDAIAEIIKSVSETDILVSTTGKISREVYEQCDKIKGHHKQAFLTVGGMGHAGMIALGIANESDKRVYCIEGDGAILMHMGELAFIAKQNPKNYIHICLNNDAHESVGGMPTGARGTDFYKVAKECGYCYSKCISNMQSLKEELRTIRTVEGPVFLEVKIALGARTDLGRPKESAVENKTNFMEYHWGK